MKTSNENRWAFKVLAGNYISEEDLEGLGISADWHLYLSPTEPPSAAECNQLMNAYELSSCPCCGGRATIIGTLKTCEWSAICTMCGLETAHMMQPKDAAAAWNRRYAPDDAGEDFEALSDAAKDRIGIPFPAPPATQQPEQPADKGDAVALISDLSEFVHTFPHCDDGGPESAAELAKRCREFLAGNPAGRLDAAAREKTNPNGDRCLSYGVNGNGQAECYWPECSCYPVTPKQPDAVAGLVEKWRGLAKHHEIKADRPNIDDGTRNYHQGKAEGCEDCADELKAALSAKVDNEDTTHER